MVKIDISGSEPPRTSAHIPSPPATPPAEQAQPSEFDLFELVDPLTGEILDRDNVDDLIDSYERLKQTSDRCYAVQMEIRRILADKTEGDAKTRRIRGKRRAAKITMPDDSWDQSILREAFHSYPQHRDECLKIDTVKVMLREYKKLVNTSGPPDFETFRDMVTKANRGPTGTPALAVEV